MVLLAFFATICILAGIAYKIASRRAIAGVAGNQSLLHSRPNYHGWYAVLWVAVPAVFLLFVWNFAGPSLVAESALQSIPQELRPTDAASIMTLEGEIRSLAQNEITTPSMPEAIVAAKVYQNNWNSGTIATGGLAIALSILGALFAFSKVKTDFRARTKVEKSVMNFLIICSGVAIITTLGIVLSLLFESARFFEKVPFWEFFGTQWSPQTAMRADQVGSSGSFGSLPLFWGTIFISLIAMVVAVPIGLMSAIYLTQYCSPEVRKILKPMLEILAGVPTVVYGFFAAITVGPLIRNLGESLGFDVASESALAAGLVMGVMIIPFMSSMADDAITAVPQAMKDGSLAMGATPSETIKRVLIPAALPGIVGGFLLAVSRAIGETMIVVMAAGLTARFTVNPLDSVTTVTTQIVAVLTGDQEFDSPKTLSAFALGLTLFFITLVLNVIALRVVKKYREAYE
jgi:phosphate transport system permease protein